MIKSGVTVLQLLVITFFLILGHLLWRNFLVIPIYVGSRRCGPTDILRHLFSIFLDLVVMVFLTKF